MMKLIARLICVILALWLPEAAKAHADFKGSDPAPNALVLERPEAVVLRFSEPVSPVAMRWISPGGDSFPVEAEPAGNLVRVAPPPEEGDGSYLLAWRVVSLDGHPVSGTIVVSIGVPSELPSLSIISWPPVSTWSVIVTKFILSMCLTVGVGGTVYYTVVAKGGRQPGSSTTGFLILVIPAALLLIGAQGFDLLGLPLGAAFSFEPWVTGAGTSILRTAIVSVVAACVALILRVTWVPRHRVFQIAIALTAWGLAATSFALSGHTATAEPEWQAVTASIVHGMAVIFWIGAFLPLLGLIQKVDQPIPELQRFSAMAIPLVLLLLASGFFMASIHAGSGGFKGLAMSGYGILLFVKVVAVVGLLFLAAHNKLILTPAVNANTPGATKVLRESIYVEVLLVMMIIAFASSFRLTPPPQTQSNEPQNPFVEFTQKNIVTELKMIPGLVGANVIELSLGYSDDTPMEPIEVKLGFSIPDKDVGPIIVPASLKDGQDWSTEPFVLPLSGDWLVTIELLVTDFDIETLTTELTVGQ